MGDSKDESAFEEDRLESLLKLQSNYISRVQRMLVNLGKDNQQRKASRVYYTTKLNKLGDYVTNFEANHREIVMLVPTADQKTIDYFKLDQPQAFEDAQFDFLVTAQAEYETKFPEKPPQSREKSEHLSSQVNLPTVSIPSFSGAHTDWKQFHDIFKSIVHSNEKIPGSHKFQYLLSALSGEARDLVAGYEICDDDYPKAWKALTEVYNDKPSMFVHIMNKFSSLESATKERPDQLRELMKATSSCLKSLESVGVDKRAVDAVITYYLIRKLPTETLAYWEQVRDRTALPSFDSLQTCVETRIRVAATVANVKAEYHTPSSNGNKSEIGNAQRSNQPSNKGKKINAYHSSKATTSTAATSSSVSQKTNSSKAAGRKFECPVCQAEGHPLRACDRFLGMAAADRKATVARIQHCANCLAFNHPESKCRSSHTCFTCGERHHSLLHVSKAAEPIIRTTAHTTTSMPASMRVNACNTNTELFSSSQVLLATALVNILDTSGTVHTLRALIDQGSEANFITESASTALQLPKQAVQAVVNGIGSSHGQAKHITTFTLHSPHNKSFTIEVDALVMGRLTNLLPSNRIKTQHWEHLVELPLADPSYHRIGRIDLVLGADVLAQIIMEGVRIGKPGTPIAQQTHFGWILSGKISSEPARSISVTSLHATSNLTALMEKFLSIESVDDAIPMTTEEQWCEQFFVDTHRRDKTGRFNVRLPFR